MGAEVARDAGGTAAGTGRAQCRQGGQRPPRFQRQAGPGRQMARGAGDGAIEDAIWKPGGKRHGAVSCACAARVNAPGVVPARGRWTASAARRSMAAEGDRDTMLELHLLAAILALATAAGHSWLGERLILGPLLRADPLPGALKQAVNRRLVRWVWHLPSAIWVALGLGVAGLALAGQTTPGAACVIGAAFAVSALANLGALRGVHFGFAMLMAAALALWVAAFAFSPA